jgi:hypothetical protein
VLVAGRSAAADEFPKGTFTSKVDDAVWTVVIDGKGKYTVSLDGKEGITGSYKVTKDVVEFTDEGGQFAGKDKDATYSYKFKVDGKKVTFTKVKDENEGRSKVITANAWEMKE